MKGIILDRSSFDTGDLDLKELKACLDHWDVYESTSESETLGRIADAEVIITNKVVINREIIEQSPELKLILLAATGTDNVDLEACRRQGVVTCNVRGYSTPAVVQHTLTLMLALSTRLIDYDHDVKQGKWQRSPVFCLLDHPISELTGKTLGIIGYGNLGKGVTLIAECFGMKVLIAQRPGTESTPIDDRISLDELLPQVDILSIHCPLTTDTHHLIGRSELQRMKKSALLINTARGAIVDQAALAEALNQGEIAGAGIDVLSKEPPPDDHPLLNNPPPNLIVTPHTAWASFETRRRLVVDLTASLRAWLDGNPRNAL